MECIGRPDRDRLPGHGLNRAPDDLSAQIDGIAESMASSERALGDLRSGLLFDEEEAPSLLSEESDIVAPPPIPISE